MEQYQFSNSHIDLACENVGVFLNAIGVERREALRLKLTLEEILLEYQEKFGEEAPFKVRCVKRFMTIKVELIVPGRVYNPLETDEEEQALNGILSGIGLAPAYGYRNGKNYVIFTPKKKAVSGTVKMGVAVGLAVVCGLLLKLLPNSIQTGINTYVLTPVTDGFMGLISAVAVPLVFLSVLGSICSMSNMETLGKIGSKTIKAILLYMTAIGLIATALGCLFFPVQWGSGEGSDFSQLLNLIYNIIPSNLFEPFVVGNTLQLIFIAIIVGLAMLVLSTSVSGIFKAIDQFNAITQTIMTGISNLFPFWIFVLFTGMISGEDFGMLMDSWKILVVFLFLILVYYAVMVLFTAFRKKVSPKLLLKKTWETTFISFTTASSIAAFQKNILDANKKLGVEKRFAEFGTSLAQVLFGPADVIILFATEVGFAEIYGIAITPQFLIMALITNLLVSFAVSPVPGGSVMGYTIAFAQLGIPLEAMGVVLALDAIIDFPATACNVSGWQLTSIHVADSLDLLDKETLRN